MEDVEEGQDWEVVVDFRPNSEFELQNFYNQLEKMGTSIQVGEGEGMYRMHIHTLWKSVMSPSTTSWGLGPSPRWPWKTCWHKWMISKARPAYQT